MLEDIFLFIFGTISAILVGYGILKILFGNRFKETKEQNSKNSKPRWKDDDINKIMGYEFLERKIVTPIDPKDLSVKPDKKDSWENESFSNGLSTTTGEEEDYDEYTDLGEDGTLEVYNVSSEAYNNEGLEPEPDPKKITDGFRKASEGVDAQNLPEDTEDNGFEYRPPEEMADMISASLTRQETNGTDILNSVINECGPLEEINNII